MRLLAKPPGDSSEAQRGGEDEDGREQEPAHNDGGEGRSLQCEEMPPIVLVLAAALAAAQSQPSFDDPIKRFTRAPRRARPARRARCANRRTRRTPGASRASRSRPRAQRPGRLRTQGPGGAPLPQGDRVREAGAEPHPDNAVGHFWAAASAGNLALLKGGKEKVRLAQDLEKDARRAIDLDPNFSPPYVALGIYYRELAELSWVLRQFAKLLVGTIPPGSLEDSAHHARERRSALARHHPRPL